MNNRRKIYFRADAGLDIGYGHYIRCLALADMLKIDFDCTMFTQSPTEYQLREAAGICNVVALPADDTRFNKFLDYLTGDEIVVLDNYFFTTDYQCSIKNKGCKLVCIDDMHDKHYVSDVVINHCIEDKLLFDIESYTHLCIGARYALLRGAFFKTYNYKKSIPWVICFGGSDQYNLTSKAIQALQNNGVQHIVAIVGDGYQYKEDLQQYKGIKVLSGLSADEMAILLAKSENVICSASTICYEALSQKCRVYAGWYVDNQYEFYNTLLNKGIIVPLGNLLENPILINGIEKINNILNLNFNKEYVRGLFLYLCLTSYNYTELSNDLSYAVWQCRNQPEIRVCMTNQQPFDFDSHCKFVSNLSNDSSKLYLAWFLDDQFVASCNLVDIKKFDSASFGIFINPLFHSIKIGSLLVHQMEYLAVVKFSLKRMVTEVLKDNHKSFRYNLSNGYILTNEDERFYYFEKCLL